MLTEGCLEVKAEVELSSISLVCLGTPKTIPNMAMAKTLEHLLEIWGQHKRVVWESCVRVTFML